MRERPERDFRRGVSDTILEITNWVGERYAASRGGGENFCRRTFICGPAGRTVPRAAALSILTIMTQPAQSRSVKRPHQPGEDKFVAIHPEDIEWKSFPAFPAGAQLAVLIGDPTKAGPYVVRVRLPAGTKMLPHKHPEDRIYTVMSGVFYIGLGETFDESKLTAYGAGSVIVLPGDQPHFHFAKSGEYVTQVMAIGPLGLSYIDPKDNPRGA